MDRLTLKELFKQRNQDILSTIKPRFVSKEERQQLSHGEKSEERKGSFLRPANSNRNNQMDLDAPNPAALSADDKKIVKERYLGKARPTKKLRRFGERKINFDWDESDDTSRGANNSSNPVKERTKDSQSKLIRTVDAFGNTVMLKSCNEGQNRFDERHWADKRLDEMQERDWRILREDFNICTSGGHMPYPLRYWSEAPFPSRLRDIIYEVGYEEPTPIQRQTIPVILAGRDLIGIAETGSGKTAAFILPMICQILRLPPLTESNFSDGPYGLVLAPTRELALQIENDAKKFCRPLGLRVTSIVGGHSMAEQSVQMRGGTEIVIATPGRLRDCLEQHVLALIQCFCIVMDEADRMIDLNFEEDLHFILSCLPAHMSKPDSEASERPEEFFAGRNYRQTTMFSATMPAAVEKLARQYLRRPGIITIGLAGQAADTVEQCVEMLKEDEKDRRLIEILSSGEFEPPIIVFVNRKQTVDFLSRRLEVLGHRCVALHGGKNQEQRESAISQLKKSGRDILIATDVAGRGIDIKDVSLVVNYDMAKTIEDYIHRIGRTGRMGKSGTAITFLTGDDSELFFELRAVLLKAPKSRISPDFLAHEASRVRPGTVVQKKRHEERIYAYGV